MRYLAFFLVCSFIIFSCKTESNAAKTTSPNLEQSTPLPAVPESYLINMYQNVDHIDYFFRNTNFSISQDEKTATQAFIATLSPGPASKVSDTCKSPLRMTFLAQGNIMVETEMYMTDDCLYVEYYIDGKKTYQSNYTEPGYNFLVNLIKQAAGAGGKSQN